jgi:molybdate transport system substrate-binding protein
LTKRSTFHRVHASTRDWAEGGDDVFADDFADDFGGDVDRVSRWPRGLDGEPVTVVLVGLASMAVQPMLAAAMDEVLGDGLPQVVFLAVGGVDAVRRVENDEVCDLVVLAQAAVGRLVGLGYLAGESPRGLATSPTAVAVGQVQGQGPGPGQGPSHPRIDDEEHLRQAVQRADAIGYSTGPSGDALLGLLERWGLLEDLQPRLVQAAPGQPVAELVAAGRVELGFQQLSELIHRPGVDVLGPLPPGCEVITTFVGAATTAAWREPSRRPAVESVLAHLASRTVAPVRKRFGLLAPPSTKGGSGRVLSEGQNGTGSR